jgi:hypothetical protein
MISEADPGLMQVIDEPDEIVNAIFDYYQQTGFEPSPSERERMLNL